MPSEIRREFVITDITSSTITLEPASANLGTHPAFPGINLVTVRTVETTPATDFWRTSGCAHFEIIIRPKTA